MNLNGPTEGIAGQAWSYDTKKRRLVVNILGYFSLTLKFIAVFLDFLIAPLLVFRSLFDYVDLFFIQPWSYFLRLF